MPAWSSVQYGRGGGWGDYLFWLGRVRRQIEEISAAFERAHELGMVQCCGPICVTPPLRKMALITSFRRPDRSGEPSGGNHRCRYVKQKMAENNGGYKAINYGYTTIESTAN